MLVNIAYCLLHRHMRSRGEMLIVPITVAKHLSPRCLSIFLMQWVMGGRMLNTNCFYNENTIYKTKEKKTEKQSHFSETDHGNRMY